MASQAQGINRQAKTVLMLSEYGVLNGGENSLLTVLSKLTAPKLESEGSLEPVWKFIAAVPEKSDFEQSLAKLGISNRGISFVDVCGQRLSQSEIRERLGALISDVQPNLIHSNSLAMSRLVGPVAKQLQVPAVGYLRDILKLSKTAIADLNANDRLVAVSEATQDFHIQQGMERNRIRVIRNGVDLQVFSADEERHSGTDSGPVILFVGQIGMRKGVDVLLDVIEKLAHESVPAKCWIVGERNSNKQEAVEYERQLHLRCEGEGLVGRVRWLGRRQDVADLMKRATVLLHPARQEPLGRVLLEAAAWGLPIVSTDVGGTCEILVGEKSRKLMVPKDDVAAMADCLVELLGDRDLQRQVSQELRRIAKDRFSLSRCAQQLDAVYRELTNEGRASVSS